MAGSGRPRRTPTNGRLASGVHDVAGERLGREHRHARGACDGAPHRCSAWCRLVEEAGGRRALPREPVDADVGEQLVAVDGVLGQLGAGSVHSLNFSTIQASWPAGESVKGVGERLRPGGLELQVALPRPGIAAAPRRAPARRRSGPPARSGSRAEQDERRRVGVHVRADDVLGSTTAERPGDAGADVASLRAVALVAEAAHQLGPGPGDARHVPARVSRAGPRNRSRGATARRRGRRRPGRRRGRAGR